MNWKWQKYDFIASYTEDVHRYIILMIVDEMKIHEERNIRFVNTYWDYQ